MLVRRIEILSPGRLGRSYEIHGIMALAGCILGRRVGR